MSISSDVITVVNPETRNAARLNVSGTVPAHGKSPGRRRAQTVKEVNAEGSECFARLGSPQTSFVNDKTLKSTTSSVAIAVKIL